MAGSEFKTVADGLRAIYKGELFTIVSAVIGIGLVLATFLDDPISATLMGETIPLLLITLALMIGGNIYRLVGMYGAGKVQSDFWTGFILTFVSLAVSIVGKFLPERAEDVVNLITSALALAVLYLVCRGARQALTPAGREDVADRGKLVWRLNLASTVVACVCSLLPETMGGYIALLVAALLFSLATQIVYWVFLSAASKSLAAAASEMPGEDAPPPLEAPPL